MPLERALGVQFAWGYRPREALFGDLLQQLPWQTPPDIVRLHTHWETWFPASSVARAGLKETLATLHVQGMRLGQAHITAKSQ